MCCPPGAEEALHPGTAAAAAVVTAVVAHLFTDKFRCVFTDCTGSLPVSLSDHLPISAPVP